MNFYTADTHFGHRNIIKYCDRPFTDVDHMNHTMANNWNAVVSPDDTVYILGDYALGVLDESLAMTGLLAGRKILVVGNHDRCFKGQKRKLSEERLEKETQRYLNAGFDQVLHGTVDHTIGDISVQMSHFPYTDDGDDRYIDHRPVDDGRWLLCGHVHERWKIVERMINVGADVWGYTPVPEDTLLEIML